MDGLNALITTLAVVFLPGLLWAKIDARYTRQAKPDQFHLLLNAFVFGLIAYVFTGLAYLVASTRWPSVTFDVLSIRASDTGGFLVSPDLLDEIAFATAIALLLALANLYCETHKVWWRILQQIDFTRRYGDEDVWDFALSSDTSVVKYVNVRDHLNGLIFTGYVRTFSETGPVREILLTEAIVYNEATGDEIYTMPSLYLCRAPETITLEFPAGPKDLIDEQH